jgi:hypothetical protein
MTADETFAVYDSMLRRHPQLSEKAVIDYVNGLAVVDDHLRHRAAPRSMFAQVWRTVTGSDLRKQQLIDTHLATGLTAAAAWLQDLQAFQAESDVALTVIAEMLANTRARLDETAAELNHLLGPVLESIDTRLLEVTQRVDELEARVGAEAQLAGLVGRWETGDMRSSSPLASAFLVVDELWWGDFGRYCRIARDWSATMELVQRAATKLAALLAASLGVAARDLLSTEQMLAPLSALPEDASMLISYLADPRNAPAVPLLAAITRTADGLSPEEERPPELPYTFSPVGFTTRLFHESRRATEHLLHVP